LLGRVREVALGAFAHQDVPFERLVDELRVPRDASRAPLFQVEFMLQNTPRPVPRVPGLAMEPFDIDTGTAKFDLSLVIEETAEGLETVLQYNTDLFEAGTVARLLGHYERLLAGAVAAPQTRLSQLPLLDDDERLLLLEDWNATAVHYPGEPCVHR